MYATTITSTSASECPPGSGDASQPDPSEGEGCSAGDLAYWFKDSRPAPEPQCAAGSQTTDDDRRSAACKATTPPPPVRSAPDSQAMPIHVRKVWLIFGSDCAG